MTARLERSDIPYGDLNSIEQFSQHTQLSGRDRWREVETPGGPMQALLPPMAFSNHHSPMGAVPSVGQHTDCILAELGYDDSAIDELRSSSAV